MDGSLYNPESMDKATGQAAESLRKPGQSVEQTRAEIAQYTKAREAEGAHKDEIFQEIVEMFAPDPVERARTLQQAARRNEIRLPGAGHPEGSDLAAGN